MQQKCGGRSEKREEGCDDLYRKDRFYHVANLDPNGNKWCGVKSESGKPVTKMYETKRLAGIALANYLSGKKGRTKNVHKN